MIQLVMFQRSCLKPRRLPGWKLEDQKRRLTGLEIKGELQPSYALLDLAASIADPGQSSGFLRRNVQSVTLKFKGSIKEKPQTLVVEQQTVRMATAEQKIKVNTSRLNRS